MKAYGYYETAGKENLTTTAYLPPTRTGSTATFRYDNLNFFKAGVAVTAMNFTAAVPTTSAVRSTASWRCVRPGRRALKAHRSLV